MSPPSAANVSRGPGLSAIPHYTQAATMAAPGPPSAPVRGKKKTARKSGGRVVSTPALPPSSRAAAFYARLANLVDEWKRYESPLQDVDAIVVVAGDRPVCVWMCGCGLCACMCTCVYADMYLRLVCMYMLFFTARTHTYGPSRRILILKLYLSSEALSGFSVADKPCFM